MVESATHPLAGCEAKLIRADEHLTALDSQIPKFLETNPHEYRGRIQGQVGGIGTYRVTIHITRQPPIEWSVVCGDFVQNLRSALDHLVWQLVIANGNTPVPGPGGNQFPIVTKRPPDLRRKGTTVNNRLRGVHRSVRAAIQRIQPYHHGSHQQHPLAVLAQLSNEDKHQAILPSFSAIPAAPFERDEIPFELKTSNIEFDRYEVYVNRPLEDGAEIISANVRITGPNPEVNMDGRIPFEVAFGEGMVPMQSLVVIRESVHEIFRVLRPVFP